MFNIENARKIGWFGRIEVRYVQPREDKKQSELFYMRGYSETELDVFKEMMDKGRANRSHNRGDTIVIPYSEIEAVVAFTRREDIDNSNGDLVDDFLNRKKV